MSGNRGTITCPQLYSNQRSKGLQSQCFKHPTRHGQISKRLINNKIITYNFSPHQKMVTKTDFNKFDKSTLRNNSQRFYCCSITLSGMMQSANMD